MMMMRVMTTKINELTKMSNLLKSFSELSWLALVSVIRSLKLILLFINISKKLIFIYPIFISIIILKMLGYSLPDLSLYHAEIEKNVSDFAQKLITQNSAQSLATTKAMINDVQGKSLEDALNYAANQNAMARATTDCRRGIHAFLNKESLSW